MYLKSVKVILSLKAQRQYILMKKYKIIISQSNFETKNSINSILLEEARIAHTFWSNVRKIILERFLFAGRKQESGDVTNKLLNIGYHHLKNKINTILEKYNTSSEIGLFHSARDSKSTPLSYDLMEMFRSDVVDSEVLKFLRLKKKEFVLNEKEISHFLNKINKRLEKEYYLKDFNRCHTYLYYMEIQILKLVKAVNYKQVFEPVCLPTRHENRCS